jgi:hypothetical protein
MEIYIIARNNLICSQNVKPILKILRVFLKLQLINKNNLKDLISLLMGDILIDIDEKLKL